MKHHKQAAQVLRIRADQIIRENAARQAKQRLIRLEAKKSVSIHEDEAIVKRRMSNTSSASNLRQRSASAMSRRRLSAVSETGGQEGTKNGQEGTKNGQESTKNKDEVCSVLFMLRTISRLHTIKYLTVYTKINMNRLRNENFDSILIFAGTAKYERFIFFVFVTRHSHLRKTNIARKTHHPCQLVLFVPKRLFGGTLYNNVQRLFKVKRTCFYLENWLQTLKKKNFGLIDQNRIYFHMHTSKTIAVVTLSIKKTFCLQAATLTVTCDRARTPLPTIILSEE